MTELLQDAHLARTRFTAVPVARRPPGTEANHYREWAETVHQLTDHTATYPRLASDPELSLATHVGGDTHCGRDSSRSHERLCCRGPVALQDIQ
jgi:hypothetical protein